MRVLLLLLALCVVVLAAGSSSRWRLSRQEVLVIAGGAIAANCFTPSDYPERADKQHADKHERLVSFSPPCAKISSCLIETCSGDR